MNIAITGGAGLIGTELCKIFNQKHNVTVLDFKEPKISEINFIKIDIENTQEIIDSTKEMDVIIHLAAALGVIETEKNPVRTLDVNSIGTKNVLEACRTNNIKKIIFSSSSEIYGEPEHIPIKETDRITPITTYGISKLMAEEYIKSYSKAHGINYTIFRLFNVYGEEQANRWVVPEFVKKIVNDGEVTIHGDGNQIRAFCHVSDIANAFSYALEKGDNQIFNIGNNLEPISIKELANRIISLSKSKSQIKFISFDDSSRNRKEIINRAPDISKAMEILEYKPKVTLDDGLTRVIKKHSKC
jgi:UDP-glucose 4-epimerase|tara:strand:- start:10793 stop:11695 length:903 start_codon:yes stop_codon:yes gene_type:complete